MHDSPKTTNKSRDNQPTADHAINFTRRPVLFDPGRRQLSRSNNQTHHKQSNDPRSNPTPSYQHQEEQRSSVARLSAVIPHTCYHTPRSTILRHASSCDNVLMTTQHVTVATKLNLPPVRFRQHYAQVHHATRKRGVHRREILQQSSKWWLRFSC